MSTIQQARCTIVFRGRVQGVGFRWTARAVAQRFAVTGWVRNDPDGSVRVVAEGLRSEVGAYLTALRARMEEFILSEEISWEGASGDFEVFDIRK